MSICTNIQNIKDRIISSAERVGRNPQEITLIAVSKTKPVEDIKEAIQCGQLHFGENKVQELSVKMEAIDKADIQWHMIGTLQTNKIKYLVERTNWIHSVGKLKQLNEIEKRAKAAQRVMNILIQINISQEDQKSGFDPEELKKVITAAQKLEWTKVHGLMGMATFAENAETVRSEFRLLRELRDSYRYMESKVVTLDHLSMGMTNDLEVAIEEGATMVRVGSAIFGGR